MPHALMFQFSTPMMLESVWTKKQYPVKVVRTTERPPHHTFTEGMRSFHYEATVPTADAYVLKLGDARWKRGCFLAASQVRPPHFLALYHICSACQKCGGSCFTRQHTTPSPRLPRAQCSPPQLRLRPPYQHVLDFTHLGYSAWQGGAALLKVLAPSVPSVGVVLELLYAVVFLHSVDHHVRTGRATSTLASLGNP